MNRTEVTKNEKEERERVVWHEESAPGIDWVHEVVSLHVGVECWGEWDGGGIVYEYVYATESAIGSISQCNIQILFHKY